MIFISGPQIAEFVSYSLNIWIRDDTSVGIGWLDDDGKLIAAACFHDIDGYRRSANLSFVVSQPAKFGRAAVKKMADIAFNEFKFNRVTMIARADNHRSLRAIKFTGAKQEGILRSADHDGCNMLVFGLLSEECKWTPQT